MSTSARSPHLGQRPGLPIRIASRYARSATWVKPPTSSPESIGHASDEVELRPLGPLVRVVADHHGREPALRADREAVEPAREVRRLLEATHDLLLVLEGRRLRRDQAH